MSEVRRAQSKLALSTRYKGADAPETIDAKRALVEAKIADAIKRNVEAAPPLTADQKARLTAILNGGVR